MSATRNPQQQVREPPINDASETGDDHSQDSIDTVIIHSDGSYHQEENLSAAGFTLETNSGDVFREHWREAPDADTSMETEAAAALAAIHEAKKYGPSYVILYSDCQPLVQRLDQDELDHSNQMYQEIHAELESIKFTSLVHIPRERNTRADDLAHRALRELRGDNPVNIH